MALQHQTLVQRVTSHEILTPVLLMIAIVAVMLLATAILGVRLTGPSYELVPDPAGVLPF